MNRLLFFILISAVLGCRTKSIIGHYQQTNGLTFPTLVLKQDSSFSFGVGFCIGNSNYDGSWSSNGKYLEIIPTIPDGIHFDSVSRQYISNKKSESILTSDTGFYIDKLIIRREILEDYSVRRFRIKHRRLYEQFIINGKVINSRCPYYILPTDSTERRRLQRKYQLKCSTLSPFQKLFIQLGILR